MTQDQTPPMAIPRVAAGALFFDDEGRVLLVKPTYKDGWEIPGGYVEPGETPSEACAREVKEELGLDRQLGRLLVADWAPSDREGDKILFVFDGGSLDHGEVRAISLPPAELAAARFYDPTEVAKLVISRLARRIVAALNANSAGRTDYLENGEMLGS